MQIGNFAEDYQKKTDEELLQLAMDSHQLTSEAQGNLTSEFAKRGISAEQIRAFGDEKKQLRIGAPEKLESVASSATVRGRGSYSIAPPLPSRHLRHRGDRRLLGASPSSLVQSPEPWSWPSACAAWGTNKTPRRSCFSHWARQQQRLQFSSSFPTSCHGL